MATKLAELMAEVSSMEAAISKTASAKGKTNADSKLSDFLDKLAMELGHEASETAAEERKEEEKKRFGHDDDKDEKKDKKDEKSEKEASMNDALIDKIASQVVAHLTKVAVDGSELTPGMPSASASAGKEETGILLKAIDETRAAQTEAGSKIPDNKTKNPNDLIKKEAPGIAAPEPLQKGASVRYTAEENEMLSKLASVGYEYMVDYYSDQIVNQKIAEAVQIERAKEAPTKIAQAILANEKTAQYQQQYQQPASAREKLAYAAQQDPQLLQALQVVASRGLL